MLVNPLRISLTFSPFLYIYSVFFLLTPFSAQGEPLKYHLRGESGIVMNAQSGAILFEKDASSCRYPASTTKVATALYALKLSGEELERSITAKQESLVSLAQEAKRKSNYTTPAYWLEPDGMHIGIKKDEVFTLRTLMEGMLISSGNDAANVIAEELGPTVPVFMEGLNAYLKDIGCLNTTLYNPHGLHDPRHQSTAFDLALMTSEAIKSPIFCEIVAKTRFLRPKTNKQSGSTYLQTNRLLRPGKLYYSKAIGVKTGYHAKAKSTFIGAARSDNRTLIAVLLGYEDRNAMFEDASKLFEIAFNQPKVQHVFLKSGPQDFTLLLPKSNGSIKTYLEKPLTLEYYSAEDPQVKCMLHWNPSAGLPIVKDQQVGELQLVSAKGEILKKAPLLASTEVNLAWPHSWLAILPSLSWLTPLWILLIGLSSVLIYFFSSSFRRK